MLNPCRNMAMLRKRAAALLSDGSSQGSPCHVLLSRSYKSLCCDKDTTNKHHTCTKQTFSYVTFVEEHTCPDNREDGTQLEERCHVPDQAQRNRREAKEGSDTGEQDGGGESTRVGTEPLPLVCGARWLLCP